MQNISLWALLNPIKSRTILVFANLALMLIGIWMGIHLFSQDIHLPKYLILLGVVTFFVSWFLYPVRRAKYRFWKYNYVRHKMLDLAILCSGMLMVITMSNRDAHMASREVSTQANAVPVMLLSKERMASEMPDTGEKMSWRKLKKSLRSQYQAYIKEKKSGSNENDTNFVILLTILGLALMAGIALLACHVSCSGSNVAGILILIGGWTIIISVYITILRNRKLKRKNNYQKNEQ